VVNSTVFLQQRPLAVLQPSTSEDMGDGRQGRTTLDAADVTNVTNVTPLLAFTTENSGKFAIMLVRYFLC
jgi:hypothetical protein